MSRRLSLYAVAAMLFAATFAARDIAAQVIMPHVTQCSFGDACVYEKVYPNCTWSGQWCTWDMQYTTIHCIGVPTSYQLNYTITVPANNSLTYTVSAFEGNDGAQDSNVMYSQIQTGFSLWASLTPLSRRAVEAPIQPVNGAAAAVKYVQNWTSTTHEFSAF